MRVVEVPDSASVEVVVTPVTFIPFGFTFKTDDSPSQGKTDKVENDVLIYKPFGSNELHYDLNSNVPLFGRAIFDITGKRVRYTNGALIENNSIDLSGLGSAVYYLTFYLQGETITKPFILE